MDAPVVRPRYGGSKVRTGCVTCKSRRVKCDEARPECQRCVKAKRPCGGYVDTFVNPGQRSSFVKFFIYTASPPRNPNVLPGLSSEEAKCFDTFRSYIAIGLAGPFTLDFWSGNLLQIAHYETAVMDAIVAVGSLHEGFESLHAPHTVVSERALRHYSKTIRRLIQLDASKTSEHLQIVLTICVLLSAFENLRGHYKASLMHISSGINVLTENSQRLTLEQKQTFGLVFTRLGNQLGEFGESAGFQRSVLVQESSAKAVGAFESISDALTTFEVMLNRSLIWLAMVEAPPMICPIPECPITIRQFDEWCLAFDKSRFDPTEPAVSILQTNREMLGLLLRYPVNEGEMGWDLYTLQFEKMVQYAELCVSGVDNGSEPVFTFSLGVLAPLYFISTRCRDPVIRRRALGILRACNRKEGIWDSLIAVRAAERIVAVEEASAMAPVVFAHQIPEYGRVKDLEIVFGDGRQAQVKYRTSRSGKDEQMVMDHGREVIEW